MDWTGTFLAAAPAGTIVAPAVVLVLCLFAGIGTVLMLPGRRETAWVKIGGVIVLAAAIILVALVLRHSASVPADQKAGVGLYFWIFSAIAVVAAIRVITHTRPVYSALYFVLTVLASAGLFVLLWAEFMAAALVLIYAGAILVTYVFVIMLAAQAVPSGGGQEGVTTPLAEETAAGRYAGLAEYDAVSREPVVASAVGFALMAVLLIVIFDRAEGMGVPVVAEAAPATQPVAAGFVVGESERPMRELGEYLFRNQMVNLELAGVILTVAMVGAIIIARRRVLTGGEAAVDETGGEVVVGPATPTDDNPHSIPVYGTLNPRQKEYPEA